MRSQRARLRAAVTGAAVVALVAATGPNGAAAPPTASTGTTTTSATPTGVPAGVQAGARAVGESALPATEKLGTTGTKVTLITGDVVSYAPGANGAEPQVEVTSPRNASFTTLKDGDHYYVYPGDARALVAAGKLDTMLFDVAYLAQNGYGDDRSQTLPVIVQYPRAATSGSARTAASTVDAKALASKADALPATTRPTALPAVGSTAVQVTKAEATKFWSSVDAPKPDAAALDAGVAKLWLDKKVTASLDVSVPQIGAPEAWAAGYDGTGVKVAVLDTGIDDTHPDFAGKIAESKSFIEGETTKDGFGHGTHVASTIVGSGAASDGRYKGVAPGAQLLVGKVLDDNGNGTESQIIAGMEWAVQSGAKIVSMSLGGCCTDGTDPMAQAVDDLSAQYGALFVIAAGNDGGTELRVSSPGSADAALTVAAVDKQDQMADFSSRGPRTGDLGLKPEIAAPGVNIAAARAEGTTMPGAVHVGDKYTTVSGTSMATPHVAGSAAILAQEHPDWSGQKIKQVLTSTTKDAGHRAYEQGTGRVDVARATTQQVYATGNAAFGKIAFPQTSPVSKPLTYVNDGDAPVTLTFSTRLTNRRGAAPDGMLTVSPASLTIPAHGSADATVIFDVTKGAPNLYGGSVHATTADGSVTVNTIMGGQKLPKQSKISIKVINRPEATDVLYAPWTVMRLDDKDAEPFGTLMAPVQSVSGDVDAGIYSISGAVSWHDRDGERNRALFTNPNVDATKDTTVTFDLRKAVPETVTTQKPSIPHWSRFGFRYISESGVFFGQNYDLPYGASKMWSLPGTEKIQHGSFSGTSTFYNGVDPVTMTARGQGGRVTLHPQYQSVNRNMKVNQKPVTMLDGRSTARIVAAGHGLPADFAGVDAHGRLALLDLSDLCPAKPADDLGPECSGKALDRVQNAKDAGAVAVLAYGAVGRQFLLSLNQQDAYEAYPTYPIPTMSLTANEGRMLAARLAKGSVTVDIDATEYTPYLYSLGWVQHDRMPAASKRVTDHDLMRTNQRVHTDTPGSLAALISSPITRTGSDALASGYYQTVRPAPFTLTTYTGPMNQDVAWTTEVLGDNYDQSRTQRLPHPGTETQSWGEQPLVPNIYRADRTAAPYTTLFCYACRNGDHFLSTHLLTNDGTTMGYIAAGNGVDGKPFAEQHLYRADGSEVAQKNGTWLRLISAFPTPYYDLPAEPTDYRMTEDYTNPIAAQKWAPHVRTERTFNSQGVTDGLRPDGDWKTGIDCMGWWLQEKNDAGVWELIDPESPCQATDELYLGYNFGLALDNTLPAESRQSVTITGFGSPYLKSQPKLSKLTLSLSYDDGKSWQKVNAKANRDGTYTGTFTLPKLSKTTGAVTVRAEATDTNGNTVKQTIDRAFGITAADGANTGTAF